MADFLGCDADEIIFGPNMTTLTFAISGAIARELKAGDEILLTHLDHDANVSPWRALEERGLKIQFADINETVCTLDLDDLARKITSRTKLVAVGYASNAVGTINDVNTIIRLAHDAGAMVYIDAVSRHQGLPSVRTRRDAPTHVSLLLFPRRSAEIAPPGSCPVQPFAQAKLRAEI
jgi:selenocysteine lyase/cysteine desulfurase